MTIDDEEPTPETPAAPLALRHPATPATINELAAYKGEALEIIDARVQVITTLRMASLRATHPEDWVLFKSPEEHGGQVVGYLQDAGADRVRDLWGIEVYGVSKPEKVAGDDRGVFHYIISGSGRCKTTGQIIEAIEGGRSSTDDFARGKAGIELDLLIRKAARANLDGNITRELAGMKSVPVAELEAAWKGTTKRIDGCRLGRGFGTRDERIGGRREDVPDVDPPKCAVCGEVGAYRPAKGNRGAFYGCPQYQKHANRKWTVDAAEWLKQQQKATAPAPAAAPKTDPKATTPPMQAGEIPFNREPGEDG